MLGVAPPAPGAATPSKVPPLAKKTLLGVQAPAMLAAKQELAAKQQFAAREALAKQALDVPDSDVGIEQRTTTPGVAPPPAGAPRPDPFTQIVLPPLPALGSQLQGAVADDSDELPTRRPPPGINPFAAPTEALGPPRSEAETLSEEVATEIRSVPVVPPRDEFESEAPTNQPTPAAPATTRREHIPSPSVPDAETDEPTVLIVGVESHMAAALTQHLGRYRVYMETAPADEVLGAVVTAAPDLICLMGSCAEDGGRTVLDQLATSTLASVVPVALVSDDPALAARLTAFRHGAAAVIPRSASIDRLAERISELAREIPERQGDTLGRLGESTLTEFVDTLAGELRSGILSVRGGDQNEAVRLVLGRGRPLTTLIDDFVERVQNQVVSAEPLEYEFEEHAHGTVELLGPDSAEGAPHTEIANLRLVLADDDASRADAVAQVLRGLGAKLMLTELTPSEAHLQRLRQLDPVALVIGKDQVEGKGYDLIRRMRSDRRLRWASLLVVDWEDLYSEQEGMPRADSLLAKLTILGEPERKLTEHLTQGKHFDARLESLGPARLVRALVGGLPLRATVRNPRYYAQLHIAEGLLAGVVGFTKQGARLEGPEALSALLNLGSGRVHVEPGRPSGTANLMSTPEVALSLASEESPHIAESIPAPPPENGESMLIPRLSDSTNIPPRELASTDVALPHDGFGPPRAPMASSSLSPAFGPAGTGSVASPALPTPGLEQAPPAELGASAPLSQVESREQRRKKAMIYVGAGLGGCVFLLALGLGINALSSDPDKLASPATSAAPSQPQGSTPQKQAPPPEASVAAATPTPAVSAPEAPTPTPTSNAGSQAPNTNTEAAPPAAASAPARAPEGALVEANIDTPSCTELLSRSDPPAGGRGAESAAIAAAKRGIVSGNLERAQRAYCHALAANPDSSPGASGLALVLLLRGDGKQAVTYALAARKLRSDDTSSRLLHGDALARAGQVEEARKELLEALKADPASSSEARDLGARFAARGTEAARKRNWARSARFFRRAHVLSPTRADAVAGMAQAYLRLKKGRAARPWAERAVSLRPESASHRILLGDILKLLGNKDAAKAAWKKALELAPRNREAASRIR